MQKNLLKLYYYLPVWLQNIGITIFGLHWYKRRFGGVFKKELVNCLNRQSFSSKDWIDYQNRALRELLLHSFDNVSYYKNIFSKLNIDKSDLEKFKITDLKKIPVLDKDTYRELGLKTLISNKRQSGGELFASSGSTGTPTSTLYSLKMHQKYFAIFEVCINYWAGIDYKVPRGVIGGRRIIKDGIGNPPYYRYNYIEKQTYFSAYHISRDTVSNYVEGMVKNKVEYMTGYASANYYLARFIEEENIPAPKLRAVLTSSEKLTKEMRDTFQRVYGCKTYDSYNGVEICNLISECEFGSLHIVPDVGIVEVVDKNGNNVDYGEIGEIISTGLLNFDQPLIRYKMGDFVKLSKNQYCRCGRDMIKIDEIVGRIEDTVIGPDGREMVRFHGIFIDIPSIIESQIIQHKINLFEIRVVVNDLYTKKDENLIRERMESQLGKINLKILIVSFIERTSSGKFKAVISNVDRTR